MTTTTPTLTTTRNQLRALALALVERAEQRARTCGGSPHEMVTKAEYEALKAALRDALTELRQCRAVLQRLADGVAQRSQSHADVLALLGEVGITPVEL